VEDRIDTILKPAFETATKNFIDMQAQVRSQDIKSDKEEQMIAVELAGFDIRYAIEIGMFLGFFRQPTTQSWIFAGRSYQMAEFCKNLYLDMTGANEATGTLFPREEDGSGYMEDEADQDNNQEPAGKTNS
jgi:hypothetical protein